MSKVVAGIYAGGVAVSSMFTVAAVASLASGYAAYSPLSWVVAFAFSAVPLGLLLFAAARRECEQREVSALALAFVVAGTALFVLVGFFAHAENLDAIVSILQIGTCTAGYFLLRRRQASNASGA